MGTSSKTRRASISLQESPRRSARRIAFPPAIVLFLLALFAGAAPAQQDPAAVKKAIEAWLKVQTQGLPGEVSFEIGGLHPGNQLAPCRDFDVSRPPGARPWGRTNVQVRCLDGPGWRIYVPVHVRVKAEYLISARPISPGQEIVAADIASQFGDLTDLPASILTDPRLAIGKLAASPIPAGRPLRSELLKTATVVRQGQSVKVVARGAGFTVTNEGRALNNAVDGQVAQVRLASGQVVSGIARTGGIVEVAH